MVSNITRTLKSGLISLLLANPFTSLNLPEAHADNSPQVSDIRLDIQDLEVKQDTEKGTLSISGHLKEGSYILNESTPVIFHPKVIRIEDDKNYWDINKIKEDGSFNSTINSERFRYNDSKYVYSWSCPKDITFNLSDEDNIIKIVGKVPNRISAPKLKIKEFEWNPNKEEIKKYVETNLNPLIKCKVSILELETRSIANEARGNFKIYCDDESWMNPILKSEFNNEKLEKIAKEMVSSEGEFDDGKKIIIVYPKDRKYLEYRASFRPNTIYRVKINHENYRYFEQTFKVDPKNTEIEIFVKEKGSNYNEEKPRIEIK
jgi:hypothetical protein